jgi:hypothetical protein
VSAEHPPLVTILAFIPGESSYGPGLAVVALPSGALAVAPVPELILSPDEAASLTAGAPGS